MILISSTAQIPPPVDIPLLLLRQHHLYSLQKHVIHIYPLLHAALHVHRIVLLRQLLAPARVQYIAVRDSVPAHIALHSNDDKLHIDALYLVDPLLDVIERPDIVDREANHENVGVRVAQRPQLVVLLGAGCVPDGEDVRGLVVVDGRAVVVEGAGERAWCYVVDERADERRLADCRVSDKDEFDCCHGMKRQRCDLLMLENVSNNPGGGYWLILGCNFR